MMAHILSELSVLVWSCQCVTSALAGRLLSSLALHTWEPYEEEVE